VFVLVEFCKEIVQNVRKGQKKKEVLKLWKSIRTTQLCECAILFQVYHRWFLEHSLYGCFG